MKNRISIKNKLISLLRIDKQKSLAIDVSQSGILHTLVTHINKNTITQLTLTGCIDARDVKYIRDNFQNLSVLDIKLVSIKAYDGPHGTCKFSILYPANEMPQNSFYDCYKTTHNSSLKSVFLPLLLTRIGYAAFLKCTNLRKLHLPNSLVYLDSLALLGCTKLTNKFIPTSLINIGDATLIDCTSFPSNSANERLDYNADLQIA